MRDLVEDFVRTVEEEAARLLAMSEAESERRPGAGLWSAKEVVGPLIDSAANNHHTCVAILPFDAEGGEAETYLTP